MNKRAPRRSIEEWRQIILDTRASRMSDYEYCSADAFTALNGYCAGNARTVDNVMSTALTLGAQLEHQCIDSEIIMAAANEITLG